MDLNRIPRPAKDAKHCKLSMLKKDGSVPTFNIFKQKQSKGWWPMTSKTDDDGERIVVSDVTRYVHILQRRSCIVSRYNLNREKWKRS